MSVEKISISVEETLGSAIRNAAREAGQPVSTWVAQAATAKLRSAALGAFLAEYQAEHGAFTKEELSATAVEMGYRTERSGAA